MATYPQNFTGQYSMQPGGRGEIFQANLPGYRNQGDRINRTNMRLNTGAHDVPNIKYVLDRRLPVLFRYGFAYGYNQIVMTKGRIVAVDPHMSQLDFDTQKAFNALTLANGGNVVELDSVGKKSWVVSSQTFNLDTTNGLDKTNPNTLRDANVPIGIIARNEYSRDDDAFNGIMPGAVLTDAMVELPWFKDQTSAEENPWGAVYGDLQPGDLVKSDANGRFMKSPLSPGEPGITPTGIATDATASVVAKAYADAYEKERQQVIGEVYATNTDLVPEGAARFAEWAIEDELNFNEFNPLEYPQNNRRGEDTVPNSPFHSDGKYPGYPYDNTFTNNDLHMLGGIRNNYSNRLDLKYQLENGIPGLTDGANVVSKEIIDEEVVTIPAGATAGSQYLIRTSKPNVVEGSILLSSSTLGATSAYDTAIGADDTKHDQGRALNDTVKGLAVAKIIYLDSLQGLAEIQLTADAPTAAETKIYVSFKKKGLSGVPTFMDWEGCQGSMKILLTK